MNKDSSNKISFKSALKKVENVGLSFIKSPGLKSLAASIMCILCGFVVGIFVMLFLTWINEGITMDNFKEGVKYLFLGPWSSTNQVIVKKGIGNMLFYTVPLIMTGLSVALAYKTGLFNIGAPGQFLMGTMGSLLVALSIDCTDSRTKGIFVWLLAIIVGVACGALWGAIPGAFKALFNINEVVVCIMTNWIAGNIVTWVFSKQSKLINIAGGKSAYLIKPGATGTYTPYMGLDKLFPGSYFDGGMIIAIVVAIVLFIILNKTTFGFELKSCGSNKHASKYAGMNEKRNIILSMVISGGLAALGGCLYYLNKGIEFPYASSYTKLPDYGFNGIPAALLANCDPIGTVFSAAFLRFISASGARLQATGYNQYVASIISSVIIYFAGFSRLFITLLSIKKKRNKEAVQAVVDIKTEEKTIESSNKVDTNEEVSK